MSYKTIVSTQELEANIDDPSWIVIDCQFDIMKPEIGYERYLQAHIPGAVYANLDKDMASPITATSGRHPLPESGKFIARLSSWGIDGEKQVVLYDNQGGSTAVRLWWLIRYFGHEAVAVLDGSIQKWQKENHAVRTGDEQREPAVFQGTPHPEMVVTADEVESIRKDPTWKLLDARIDFRFNGQKEPIDSIAGHIPGAVNRFHGENLNPEGTFLDSEVLGKQFEAILGDVPPARVAVYCGSGVTSCHHILAMEQAGLHGAKLYVGSWSEWIRDPLRPRSKPVAK